MIPIIFAMAAMSAPAGYLAGEVFCEMNEIESDVVPIICALFLPVAAIVAAVTMIQANMEARDDE